MKWQLAAGQEDRKPDHIAITRCSSVVALVLNGKCRDISLGVFRFLAYDRRRVRLTFNTTYELQRDELNFYERANTE